jgi:hypothetical protein
MKVHSLPPSQLAHDVREARSPATRAIGQIDAGRLALEKRTLAFYKGQRKRHNAATAVLATAERFNTSAAKVRKLVGGQS